MLIVVFCLASMVFGINLPDFPQTVLCDAVTSTGICSLYIDLRSFGQDKFPNLTVELQASGQPATSFTVALIGANDPIRFTDPDLAIGSTPANVSTIAFNYWIGYTQYTKAAVAAGTALSGANLPTAKTGAWALDIGTDGTIDITPAADNVTGYASATLALAGIPAVANMHQRIGTVTVANTSGADFIPGTTNLDAVGIAAIYADYTANYATIKEHTYTIATPSTASFTAINLSGYRYLKMLYSSKAGGGATSAITGKISGWR